MNVLVIGDEHTYGYGLQQGKLSYLGHFIRHISQAGQSISVEVYAHLSVPQLYATLTRLPLKNYDLIMLQIDQNLLFDSGRKQQELTSTFPYQLLDKPLSITQRIKSVAKGALSMVWPFYGLKQLESFLKLLRPYRHNVLLLTPFPHRMWHESWIRERGRDILLSEADEQLFSVFDTDSVIKLGDEYFLSNDPKHLSDISHELLGLALFDFYQSAPTIVTIQSIRRDE